MFALASLQLQFGESRSQMLALNETSALLDHKEPCSESKRSESYQLRNEGLGRRRMDATQLFIVAQERHALRANAEDFHQGRFNFAPSRSLAPSQLLLSIV